MIVKFTIYRRSDWKAVDAEFDVCDADDDLIRYMFDEGNQSCDCNRGDMFGDEDQPCNQAEHDQQYLISYVTKEDGSKIDLAMMMIRL